MALASITSKAGTSRKGSSAVTVSGMASVIHQTAISIVIAATAAGVLTLQWYMDGVALPCTLKRVTLPASGNAEIHTETDLELSGCCCCVNHTFTLVATTDSTAAGSVIELCTGLLKLA